METQEKWMKYGGWLLSLLTILAGVYFLWPRIHIALLGIALIYFGVRIFNFSMNFFFSFRPKFQFLPKVTDFNFSFFFEI